MKKILLLVSSTVLLTNTFFAQDSEFDKKFRLGLRVAAQPTWFSSKDNGASKLGTGFGFGFGLVTEFRLSEIVHFGTGIGGDFESGSIKYKYDPTNASAPYSVSYFTDNTNNIKELKDDNNGSSFLAGDVFYSGVTERKIKTTHVTIPLTLKLLTKELSGFKYFGVFGADLGIRIKARAEDKYTNSFTVGNPVAGAGGTNSNVNISKDASLIPIRFGLNVGAGAEYRLAGSTSVFLSINYFRSFTNLMRNESKYMVSGSSSNVNGNTDYFQIKQGLLMNAIRINVGVLF